MAVQPPVDLRATVSPDAKGPSVTLEQLQRNGGRVVLNQSRNGAQGLQPTQDPLTPPGKVWVNRRDEVVDINQVLRDNKLTRVHVQPYEDPKKPGENLFRVTDNKLMPVWIVKDDKGFKPGMDIKPEDSFQLKQLGLRQTDRAVNFSDPNVKIASDPVLQPSTRQYNGGSEPLPGASPQAMTPNAAALQAELHGMALTSLKAIESIGNIIPPSEHVVRMDVNEALGKLSDSMVPGADQYRDILRRAHAAASDGSRLTFAEMAQFRQAIDNVAMKKEPNNNTPIKPTQGMPGEQDMSNMSDFNPRNASPPTTAFSAPPIRTQPNTPQAKPFVSAPPEAPPDGPRAGQQPYPTQRADVPSYANPKTEYDLGIRNLGLAISFANNTTEKIIIMRGLPKEEFAKLEQQFKDKDPVTGPLYFAKLKEANDKFLAGQPVDSRALRSDVNMIAGERVKELEAIKPPKVEGKPQASADDVVLDGNIPGQGRARSMFEVASAGYVPRELRESLTSDLPSNNGPGFGIQGPSVQAMKL